jgi:hypothetical protein
MGEDANGTKAPSEEYDVGSDSEALHAVLGHTA